MRWIGELSEGVEKRGCGTDEAPSTHDCEIDDSIALFAEPIKFCSAFYAEVAGYTMTDIDRDDLADKGEKYDVVCNEDKVEVALLVTDV